MRQSAPPLRRWNPGCAPRPPAATKYRAYRTTCSANCSRWCARKRMARPTACPRPAVNRKSRKSSNRVLDRVMQTRVRKTFEPQPARIAQAARAAPRVRIVTTMRQSELNAQLRAQLDDLAFGKLNQRRMNFQMGAPFHAGLGYQIGHVLEGGDKFWPAIGVSGIIDGVHADKNVGAGEHLRPSQREREENRIARRNIGDRDALTEPRFGDRNVGRESRSAESAQIDSDNAMPGRSQAGCHTRGGFKLGPMPLAIVETERIATIAFAPRDSQAGGRIQASAQQTDRGFQGRHCRPHTTEPESSPRCSCFRRQ